MNQENNTEATPRKQPTKRERKAPTIASYNEQIEAKQRAIEALQADIKAITAKRNALFVLESEMLGLMDILADPESAEWLASKVKETNAKRN